MLDGSTLAIICGGGSLPFAVADSVIGRGRRVMLFAIRGWADATAVQAYAHRWIALGKLGQLCRAMRSEGCREVVFIGQLSRPAVSELRFDWDTLLLLPRIARAFRGGDDHLLSHVGKFFEERGFNLLGAHEVAPEIVLRRGLLGRCAASSRDLADIDRGLTLLQALSPFDVGQAVIVADNHVLAIEAAEGTDAMVARIAEQRQLGRIRSRKGVGVLVKAPKLGQDQRFDLPSIGPETIERAAYAGLAGVAAIAGATIVAEPVRVATVADRENLFVMGIDAGGSRQ